MNLATASKWWHSYCYKLGPPEKRDIRGGEMRAWLVMMEPEKTEINKGNVGLASNDGTDTYSKEKEEEKSQLQLQGMILLPENCFCIKT
jgi:hypothetical protein